MSPVLLVPLLLMTAVTASNTTTTATTATTTIVVTTSSSNHSNGTTGVNASTTPVSNANTTTTPDDPITTTTMIMTTDDDNVTDWSTQCHFAADVNANLSILINSRCRGINSFNTATINSKTFLNPDVRRCGVTDASNAASVGTSDICYSDRDQGIAKTFVHTLRITNVNYQTDYADYRRKLFRDRKNQVETYLNPIMMSHPTFRDWDFESVLVLKILQPEAAAAAGRKKRDSDPWRRERSKRDASTTTGIDMQTLVRFGPAAANVTVDDYWSEWNNASLVDQWLRNFQLNKSAEQVEDVGSCPAILATQVPKYLRNSSSLAINESVPWSETVGLTCPVGRKLSFDNDSVGANDDVFSLICTVAGAYLLPQYWPICGDWCYPQLPVAPSHSGLVALEMPNTVPKGGFGVYACLDSSLGVESGASGFFNVGCINGTKYDVPAAADEWPVCRQRTTTIRTEIFMALDMVVAEYKSTYDAKYQNWKMFDEMKATAGLKSDYSQSWFSMVTLPALGGLAAIVVCCCWFTHLRSPFCCICAEEKKPEK